MILTDSSQRFLLRGDVLHTASPLVYETFVVAACP
jgi:hypothetical protein